MKKNVLMTMSLVLSFMTSYAQSQNLAQEEEDSTINVVAYFCKNDTMDYRVHELEQKIQGNDTTLLRYVSEDFRLIVRDSTSSGYKIEYYSLGNRELEGEQIDFFNKTVLEKMGELSDKVHVIFTIDELGNLQHIENWREIKNIMREGFKLFCDSLYANTPMLDSVMPRIRLEMSLSQHYSTEESIMKNFDELQLLFGIHGKAFTIGKHETKDDSGYPSVTNTVASYGSFDEEDEIEGDYYVGGQTTLTIPAEDVATLVGGQLSGILSDDALKQMQEANHDSKFEDVNLTILEAFFYFYNGWPCDMSKRTIVTTNGYERITTKHVGWLSRRWQIYNITESDQGKAL